MRRARSRPSCRRTWSTSTPLPCAPRPGPSSGTSTPSSPGTRIRSSRPPRWPSGSSTSRPTSSPRSARRRSRRSPPRPGRPPARSRRGPPPRRRPSCPAPPESPTRSSWPSSTSSSSDTPSGVTCAASMPALRARDPRLGLLQAPRDARLPEPRRDRAARSRSCRSAGTGPPPRTGAARDSCLTDPRMTRREILGETHYCLLCHDREKDSCSKGFFDAKTSAWQKNPLGIALKGCPLDEKISEMHQLRREGDSIGALALVAIDNPMCPGTGHRICNDCMKGCIFQKQDPVNIPQIETGVLTDVLALPWGVEIYGLLTRWNPLHPGRPEPPAVHRQEGPRRRPGPGRLHARALPPERRLRRRRDRRPQDRAAAGRPRPAPTAAGSGPSATGASSPCPSTSGRSRASAASPSTASPCAGTRTS